MTTECPNCKAPIARQGQRFCYQCGTELQGQELELREAKPFAPTEQITSADLGTEALGATLRILLPTGDVFDREIAGGETRLGKGPRNDIVIADPAVSSSHAIIRRDASGYFITDVGSRNGTFVGRERLTEPHRLKHGDVIALGRSRLTLRLSGFSDTDAIQSSEVMAAIRPPAPPPLTEDSLADALIEAGLVKRGDVERLRSAGRLRLYRALIEEQLVSQGSLRDLMSRTFHIPAVDLRASESGGTIPAEFPARLATDLQVFPISVSEGHLMLAVADPTDTGAVEEVARQLQAPIDIRLATADEIAEAISQRYGPKLVGVLPSGEKLEYPIKQDEIKIGKASHNDIVLADPTVSNSHAIILARGDEFNIVDLDSRNGTFVGGERLGIKARLLRHGDTIQLGKTVIAFRNPLERSENITVTLSEEMISELRRRAKVESDSEGLRESPAEPASAMSQEQVSEAGAPVVVPSPLAAPPEGPLVDQTPSEEGEKKKKKKKKKKDERIKAAYVGAISRILAQILGVVLAVGITLYLTRSGSTPQKGVVEISKKGHIHPKISKPGAGTPFQGGTFEASGVVQVNGSDGDLLIVDDGRPGEVLLMTIDQSGMQVGSTVKTIPLGVTVEDPEAITYGGGYYYIAGSQSNRAAGERNALVRFGFDAASQTLQGQPEVIPDLRRFLISNIPELKGSAGDKDAGLNIEGIAWDPAHERLLLGLRAPLVGGRALVVPIKLINPRGPFSADNIAKPQAIQLSLGGLGIRDVQYDTKLKLFLIIAGAPEHHERADFKLWEWNGEATEPGEDLKQLEEVVLDHQMKPEGIAHVKVGGRDFLFVVGDGSSYMKLEYADNP